MGSRAPGLGTRRRDPLITDMESSLVPFAALAGGVGCLQPVWDGVLCALWPVGAGPVGWL